MALRYYVCLILIGCICLREYVVVAFNFVKNGPPPPHTHTHTYIYIYIFFFFIVVKKNNVVFKMIWYLTNILSMYLYILRGLRKLVIAFFTYKNTPNFINLFLFLKNKKLGKNYKSTKINNKKVKK